MATKGIGGLKELPKELHMVYDTETGEYWSNGKGKSVWANPGHAKNAWNCCNYRNGPFSNQSRYVIHTFEPGGWKLSGAQLGLNLG